MIKTELANGRVRNRSLKDYSGLRFGRLVALSLSERDVTSNNNHLWVFECDCGAMRALRIKNVRSGHTSSCGCIAKEALARRNTTHGLSALHKAEYRSWKDMRGRCNNPSNTDFPGYGGRGISVSADWGDFSVFLSDMGPRGIGHTLDRIDVNGNYEAANCRWASASQQANNKRSNRILEMDGCSKTLQQWCTEYAAEPSKVRYRLSRGMSLRAALKSGDLRRNEQTLHRHC